MQFVDKGINRVLKWESVDVTIPEMIGLVQTEILEKASEKDLAELEKGMQKTFVLMVGSGSNRRYYPSSSSPARLCLEFNVFTHQLHKISLQDTVNKKEYFIPTGKASCTRLQSGVLRRMRQYTPGGVDVSQKIRNNGKHVNETPERQNKAVYCKYCGERLDRSASFCKKCGKPQYRDTPRNEPAREQGRYQPLREDNTRKAFDQGGDFPYGNKRCVPGSGSKGGKFAQKRRSPAVPILRIVGVIALCAVLVFGILALVDHLGEPSTAEDIAVVQNGYLGEYTDLTVKEILDSSYGLMYESSLWDGGTTDSGNTIVQVKYFNEENDIEPTIIRFSMMNRECFKISTFIDPSNPIEKSDDLFAAMNYNYMLAHFGHNRATVENKEDEYDFIQRLNQIPGSAVAYGAAASYNGDRSKLCELDNETPLGLSAAMLLDKYGLLDMSYYLGVGAFGQVSDAAISESENTPAVLPDNEREGNVTESNLPETVSLQTEPPAYEGSLELLVTVTESSGGLNIRSGPGASYEKMGRLESGETVTVTKVQSNGSSQWGKIDRGWICMDYVEVAGQRPNDTSSVSMTVCVKPSAGELKIRSGPGSSYNEVGRLRGGEYATVTELQQNGNSQWGRIPTGWICMDYVDTVYGVQESYSGGWQYEGNWIEDKEANKHCMMEIERVEDDLFLVEIQVGISASEQMCWSTPAFYDADWDCLFYSGCECWISVSMGNGNFYQDVQYEDGMGSLYMKNGALCWEDYTGNNGASYFVPDNRPIFD